MHKIRSHPFNRLHRLGRERRQLLLRAALMLSAASAAVGLLPFRRAVEFGCVPVASGRRRLRPDDCVWAVEAAARRLPWRAKCIEQGLVVQRMLRRSGTDARLHYGARHHPVSGRLEAHVWVSVAGEIVIGREEAPAFAEIAAFP